MFKSVVTKKHYNNLLIIGSFIVLSIMSVCLLLHTHILLGASDMQFHMRRIAELRASFSHGNFFPRFALNEFNGSSVMSMYPYLNLFPLILLSFIVKSSIKLLYVMFIINTFVAFLISYYGSLRVNHNELADYLFAIFYCTSTLYLDYGFFNMDLGMLSVITFLPLAIFGLFDLITNDRWVELSLGMTLIVFSHVLSILIISAFLVLLLLINYHKITVKIIKNLCKAAILTGITTAIFWVPFVHIMLSNSGNMNRPGGSNLYGTSFRSMIFGAVNGEGTYGISFFAIIGIILAVVLFKYLTRFEKQMLILSIIMVYICSDLFPWKIDMYGIFNVLRGFQFTWRFYILPQLLLCYLCGICVDKIIKHFGLKKLSIGTVIIVAMLLQFVGQNSIINNNIHSHALTQNYIHKYTYYSKVYVHHHIIHMNILDVPHPLSIKRPESYKLTNQTQYNNLISPYYNAGLIDYFPMNALPKFNTIINNRVTIPNNNKYMRMRYLNYNHFQFHSNNTLKSVYLPLVRYNSENLNINLNGKTIKDCSNKYNLIMLKHIRKGNNNIRINVVNNKFGLISELILLILGILIYSYKFIIRSKDL